MSRARHILAVVAVTTALCADQVVSAAPLPRPHVNELAARFVSRIAQTFRRTPTRSIRVHSRFQVASKPSRVLCKSIGDRTTFQPEFSPFQFRLPPPTV